MPGDDFLGEDVQRRFTGGRGLLRVGAAADLVTYRWATGARTLDVTGVVAAGRRVVPVS